jgi:hypothetical protein
VATDVFGDTTFLPGAEVPLAVITAASTSHSIRGKVGEEAYEAMSRTFPEMFHDTLEPLRGWSEETDHQEEVEVDVPREVEEEDVTTPQALAHLDSIRQLGFWNLSRKDETDDALDPNTMTIMDYTIPLDPLSESTVLPELTVRADPTAEASANYVTFEARSQEITIRDVTLSLGEIPRSAPTRSGGGSAGGKASRTTSMIAERKSTPYKRLDFDTREIDLREEDVEERGTEEESLEISRGLSTTTITHLFRAAPSTAGPGSIRQRNSSTTRDPQHRDPPAHGVNTEAYDRAEQEEWKQFMEYSPAADFGTIFDLDFDEDKKPSRCSRRGRQDQTLVGSDGYASDSESDGKSPNPSPFQINTGTSEHRLLPRADSG